MNKFKYPVGKCTKMCSDEELKIRRKQKMIDRFESVGEEDRQADRKPDPNKMVKKYFRIGVSTEPTISDLRTPETLENTINYLLTEILDREDRVFHEIYNFVFDRLKAVKQDMVVQNLSIKYYITFYQPMVKFYAYAFYRLCDAPDDLFELTLHTKEFIETLKVLLGLYSKYDAFCSDPETGVKTNLDIYNAFKKERPLMECLYLLCTIGPVAMRRTLNLEEEYRTPLVKKCYKIVRELNNNNFAVFENEVKELPPLLAAIAASHMPKIRGFVT